MFTCFIDRGGESFQGIVIEAVKEAINRKFSDTRCANVCDA
jgi:hypothetical protein